MSRTCRCSGVAKVTAYPQRRRVDLCAVCFRAWLGGTPVETLIRPPANVVVVHSRCSGRRGCTHRVAELGERCASCEGLYRMGRL